MDTHLRDLRYFVAVAEELHFTRAAERLYVSQPALSKQVRMLEKQLGVTLLERSARAVSLTPAGAALLPAAQDLLARWDAGLADVRRAAAPRSLVLGLQTAVGRDLVRDAMARVRALGLRVSLRLVSWDDPSAGLADRTSDVAVVWLPLPGEGLTTRTLVTEELWVALPAGHPLAGRSSVGVDELRGQELVALPAAAGPLRDFWLARDVLGDDVRVAAEATSAEEALEAVASGLGAVLVAEGNARLHDRPDVVCRPTTGLAPARLALAWRADDRRPELVDLVAAFG